MDSLVKNHIFFLHKSFAGGQSFVLLFVFHYKKIISKDKMPFRL
jgi:hypothetical protein